MNKIKSLFQSLAGIFLINILVVTSLAVAQTVPVQEAEPNAPNAPITSQLSSNWAGYVADQGTFTAVSGTWTIPKVESSQAITADAAWVGIGGVKGEDLIQAGSQTIVQDGEASYKLWYETLPEASTIIPLQIKPGDSVTVTINEISTDNWQINFRNNTTGLSYIQNLNYHSSHSSAEWIEEMPLAYELNSFIPLDNFGALTFSNAGTTRDGISVNIDGAIAKPLSMATRGGNLLAAVGSVTSGNSFTVSRTTNQSINGASPHLVVITVSRSGHRTRDHAEDLTGNPLRTERQLIRQIFDQYGHHPVFKPSVII